MWAARWRARTHGLQAHAAAPRVTASVLRTGLAAARSSAQRSLLTACAGVRPLAGAMQRTGATMGPRAFAHTDAPKRPPPRPRLGGSLAESADDEGAAAIAERQRRAALAVSDPVAAANAATTSGVSAAEEDAMEATDAADDADADVVADADADVGSAEDASAQAIDAMEQSMAEKIAAVNMRYDTSATYSQGSVHTLNKGFAIVDGLPTANLGALVHITSSLTGAKLPGIVTSMDHQRCSVALLTEPEGIRPHDKVTHYNEQLPSFPFGMGVVGRVLNPLGEPLDGRGPVTNVQLEASVDRRVPSITQRARIQSMIESGIKHFDVFHPLAKGMRMGLFGPRKSGKSSLVTRIVANQTVTNRGKSAQDKLYCVMVLVGQSKHQTEKTLRTLQQSGAMEYTTVVVAENTAPVGLQYLAPYAGCTAAEYFRDNGMHALVVYDDMSSHGAAYNLMLRSSGARLQAVTYVQAKILERASYMSAARGGGSLTALCLYERNNIDQPDALSNMEGFVDQIVYTDAQLALAGVWPPINCSTLIGRPPTRYQPAFTRPVTRQMTELISHSLESARNFEWAKKLRLQVDDDDVEVLEFKEKLQVLLSQERAMPLALQFISLYAAGKDLLSGVDLELVPEWEKELHLFMYHYNRPILYGFDALKHTDAVPADLLGLLDDAIARFAVYFPKYIEDQRAAAAKQAPAAPATAKPASSSAASVPIARQK